MNTQPMATRRAAAALDVGFRQPKPASDPRRRAAAGAVRRPVTIGGGSADVVAAAAVVVAADSAAPPPRAARASSWRSRPNAEDMLLSGVLVGGQTLAGRAQVVDAPVGQGHVVMFAIRPFWRWQTQGTFFLGFNAILNWNDLDAGRAGARRPTAVQ